MIIGMSTLAPDSGGSRIVFMHPSLPNIGSCLGLMFLLAFPASSASADSGRVTERNPPCIHYRAEAVLGFAGYNHLVYINNACANTAYCDVMTSANPVPVNVTIAPSETLAVITYRESPARVFQVKVQCRLEGA